MEYKITYKCRLCGEVYAGGCTGNKQVAIGNAIASCAGERIEPFTPELTAPHFCKDGGIGIADFQGFKADEDREEKEKV